MHVYITRYKAYFCVGVCVCVGVVCILYYVYRCRAYQSDGRRRKCTYENEKKRAHGEGESPAARVLKSLKRVQRQELLLCARSYYTCLYIIIIIIIVAEGGKVNRIIMIVVRGALDSSYLYNDNNNNVCVRSFTRGQ